MEHWDGKVLDINATCADLGPQCLQLLGKHSISGCDTTSYLYAKGKFSALKTMLDGDFSGLDDVLSGVGATHEDLLITATTFFLALYGQAGETSIESARFTLYTRNKTSPKVKDLPAVAERDPAPPQLSDVINCQCNAVGKKCSTDACGCYREHLSCTNYYNCRGHDGCCNPHTTQGVMQAVDDDNAEIDDAGEEMVDGEEDVVVVADGEDENADSNNLDDEWE